MDFQATLEQLTALGKRSEPFADRYMSETEREDFDGFVRMMSPVYQSVILFSTVGLTIGELDASELVEVLSEGIEGIEGIEEELRRQYMSRYSLCHDRVAFKANVDGALINLQLH